MSLKNFRKTLGLAQAKMAIEIGVSLSMYEKVERGYLQPSANFMKKLKGKYPEINIDDIFFRH